MTQDCNSKFVGRAWCALGVIALGYSALFLVFEALLTPEQAQVVIAVALPMFVLAAFVGVRAAGLWRLSGLACVRGDVVRVARPVSPACSTRPACPVNPARTTCMARAREVVLPCAIALLIPVVNVIGGWEAASSATNVIGGWEAASSAAGSAPSVSLAVCVIVGCAALIEELCFRGLLMGAFDAWGMRSLLNVGITSAIFAALHAFNVGTLGTHGGALQCALAFFLGATFGFVRLSLQNLYPCMLIHVLINLTAAATTLYNESLLWIELAFACMACASAYACWRRRATRA